MRRESPKEQEAAPEMCSPIAELLEKQKYCHPFVTILFAVSKLLEKKKKSFLKKVSMLKNVFVRLFSQRFFYYYFSFPPGKTTWMYSETILPI